MLLDLFNIISCTLHLNKYTKSIRYSTETYPQIITTTYTIIMNTKLWASANELINRLESTNKMYFSPWPPFPPPLDFGKRPNCLFYFGTPSRLPLKGKLETKAPITSLKAICKRYYHTGKVNWTSWLGNVSWEAHVSYTTCNSGYWFE